MSDDYVPKFAFAITEEQKARADKLITTYGLRKAIFSRILDDVLDLIEEHGSIVIGALLSPKVTSTEVIESMNDAEGVGKTHGKHR